MAKKLSIFTSLALGVVGGTAAAVFLTTESGKKLKQKVSNLVKDYQEHSDELHTEWVNKAHDLKNQVVNRYETVKDQFESGEVTIDDLVQTGKQKVQGLAEQVRANFSESESATERPIKEAEPIVEPLEDMIMQDDIEIDL